MSNLMQLAAYTRQTGQILLHLVQRQVGQAEQRNKSNRSRAVRAVWGIFKRDGSTRTGLVDARG